MIAPDGNHRHNLTNSVGLDSGPDWQPIDRTGELAIDVADSPDPVGFGALVTYTVSVQNRGATPVTSVTVTNQLPDEVTYDSASPSQGTCTEAGGTVTCELGTLPGEAFAYIDIRARVDTGEKVLTDTASVSAAEPDPYPINNTNVETTGPSGFPRPLAAAQFRVPLAIAHDRCAGAADRVHGGGLTAASCEPALQSSGFLTVGTLDSNGHDAQSVGFVRFAVCPGGTTTSAPCDTPEGMAVPDVKVDVGVTDVRCLWGASGGQGSCEGDALSDYLGELQVKVPLRITDKHNSGPGRSGDPATSVEVPLSIRAFCVNDAASDPNEIGASCQISGALSELVPGAVAAGKRANWELGQVAVVDGGNDGSVFTSGNSVFARQGVFVP